MKRLIKAFSLLFAAFLALALVPFAVLADEEMPYWYPEDVSSWVFTPADPDAPRVVDDADIFTDEEERMLEARIREIAPKYEADIVVFTDMSAHGLSVPVYAADFYDFCGYGYGEEHDGICLFILMDPADRQGWVCATGRLQPLYTEDVANQLDDVLYEYLGSGEYFEGVYDWIGNIGTFLGKGVPFAPDWMPSSSESFVRYHDSSAPRATDVSGRITEDELAELDAAARGLAEKYGLDVVIHFSNTSYNMSRQSYCDAYYYYNGYGFGEDFDGILATVFTGSGTVVVTPYGSAVSLLNEKKIELLEQGAEDLTSAGDMFKAGSRLLSYLGTTLRTGRVPRTPIVWGLRTVFSAVVALIVSSVMISTMKKNMQTIRTAYEADKYLAESNIVSVLDEYTHSSTSRVYSPIQRSSGGGGGGRSSGGSSHSSSYHGSSGTSHSGSGRRF